MAKILIAGALDLSQPAALQLVQSLGEEVIVQGHTLVNGCRNEFDRAIAGSAHQAAVAEKLNVEERITSYVVAGSTPVHDYGRILRSRLVTWGLEFECLHIPEPIHECEAVIIVGGQEGTLCAANWARIDKKPLLPITAFGGAGLAAYNEEVKEFDSKYADRIDRSEYDVLNQVSTDMRKIARDAVALAARIQASRQVFAIMSFSADPKLRDAFDSFQEVCEEYGYVCKRVDDMTSNERIVPMIIDGIRKSAFVIADLTEPRPNVYYEFGLAQGLAKSYIVTAYKGTTLPFDVHDVPALEWESQRQLKDMLRQKVQHVAVTQGRRERGTSHN
jgi:hypothetical protein